MNLRQAGLACDGPSAKSLTSVFASCFPATKNGICQSGGILILGGGHRRFRTGPMARPVIRDWPFEILGKAEKPAVNGLANIDDCTDFRIWSLNNDPEAEKETVRLCGNARSVRTPHEARMVWTVNPSVTVLRRRGCHYGSYQWTERWNRRSSRNFLADTAWIDSLESSTTVRRRRRTI